MFKRCLVVLMMAAGLDSAANSGIWASFVQITANGGSAQWFDAQNSSVLPDFQGADLGAYNPFLGDTLVLSGGEVDTEENGTDNVFLTSILNWRVWSGTPSGSFNTTALTLTSNEPFTNAAGVEGSLNGSFDQQWATIVGTPDVLQGLSAGSYTLEVYFRAPFTSQAPGDLFHLSNNGGANYQATFTVVPEPSTYALAGVGLLALLARRRMAKRA